MRYSVAIVAIARNEGQYINEWIEYHSALGFDHFYIYDNSFGKEERLSQSISPENRKLTSIIPAYNKWAFQKQAYGLAYNKFGQNHDYLLFIDIDEFFTLVQHKDISEYIGFLNSRCPGFQNARIHWEIYDDNNVIERDMSIPVHRFFTQVSSTREANRHNLTTKSLVKTKMSGIYFPNVHFPRSRTSSSMVICDSTGMEVNPDNQFLASRNVSIAKIRHYVTKTISEYMYQKLCRGDADGYIVRNIWNRFFNYCKETPEKIRYYNEHKGDVYVGKYAGIKTTDNIFRSRKDKIVVTMTSWKKRITNCSTVIESVLRQTMKPNVLFLNLSLDEFPGREHDLPSDLVQLIKKHPEIKINWLEGNIKSFKKLFPILPYLEDNDIIMLVDDDYILEDTTIQSRYKDFNLANRTYVIVSDWMDCGQTMMFQKKMLNGYETFFVPEVINTGNDDAVYFNIFHLNGYKVKKGSSAFFSNSNRFIRDQYGLTDNHQYLEPPDVTLIMEKIVRKQFNDKWENLFGVFRRGQEFDGKPSSCCKDACEIQLEKSFNERMQSFFYGDRLQMVEDAKKVLFVGSDIPSQMNKDTMCCGLGWKYLPGQKHRDFRQLVPPANFCYLRGNISRRQVKMEGVNLRKDIPVGDSRLFSAMLFGEQNPIQSMDIGIAVGCHQKQSREWYINLAKEKFPDREIGFIQTAETNFAEFSEFVSQCKIVLSSSLWGVVVAHSFGIPAICFLESNSYEFMDYYSVFNRIRYSYLSQKITFQDGLDCVPNLEFISKVNPTKDEVKLVQKNILSAFPYEDIVTNGIID